MAASTASTHFAGAGKFAIEADCRVRLTFEFRQIGLVAIDCLFKVGHRPLKRPFLLVAGILVMVVVYTGWGLWEIYSLPKATLP